MMAAITKCPVCESSKIQQGRTDDGYFIFCLNCLRLFSIKFTMPRQWMKDCFVPVILDVEGDAL
jgi:hypothetical protein